MSKLLFEIGTEEIPASYIAPALDDLARAVAELLSEKRLAAGNVCTAGTPRRLVVFAEDVPEHQPGAREEIVGPPAQVAYDDDGNPTKAAEGFARSQGLTVEDLEIKETEKGPYAAATVEHEGQPAVDILPDVLQEAVAAISSPKSMRWPDPGEGDEPGQSAGIRFARPIRWLMALFDEDVVPIKLAGLEAGRTTFGHPFLFPDPIELPTASYDDYRERLKEAGVIVGMEERRESVRNQVDELLSKHGSTRKPPGLVQEVANLVEHPFAIEGTFEDRFLPVPDCVLCAAMIEHQRYFPVWDSDGNLLNRFVIVSNRTEAQEDIVREGNERVLRARLDDARFFWEEDREVSLEDRVPRLEGVVFLGGLGNNLQRTQRLEESAARIADLLKLPSHQKDNVRRAARICKADLLTGLVGEFPSLQGQVGRELALDEGMPEPVADAIAEHYLPAGADDDPPSTPEGLALALADKMDVMAGCFALGHEPSGSQDPYALRRNALGVLMILERRQLDVRLSDLVRAAEQSLEAQSSELSAEDLKVPVERVLEFFRDRLYHAAVDAGHPHDLVRAVLSAGFENEVPAERLNYNVAVFWDRLRALEQCAEREWWPDLVELVDRTYRIQRDLYDRPEVEENLLEMAEEKQLAEKLSKHRAEVRELFAHGDYLEGAERYCDVFAEEVHDFFEEVFVNVDDEDVRRNRKALCGQIYHLFADHIGDLYLIEDAEQV